MQVRLRNRKTPSPPLMSKVHPRRPGTWFLTGFIKVTQILIIYGFVFVTYLWESRPHRKSQTKGEPHA